MILHCALDSFFVSVERVEDPSLCGKPVAVGGSASGRGVIASGSYEARKLGIHSGMPTAKALSLCPDLILVKPVSGRYSEYSKRFFSILKDFTPDIQVVSIDEAYLDVSRVQLLWGNAHKIAVSIRERTQKELGIPVSIGIGSSRYIAKCGSKLAKPDGLYVVTKGSEEEFLRTLEVKNLNGVGPKMTAKLKKLGIYTVGQVMLYEKDFLEQIFGKAGLWLYSIAAGEYSDSISFIENPIPRSIGNSRTFIKDLPYDLAVRELRTLATEVGRRARKKNLFGKTVTLKVRYSDFSTFTTAHTLNEYTNFTNTIHRAAIEIFGKYSDYLGKFRLLGITLSNIIEGSEGIQFDLWDHKEKEKLMKLYNAVDKLNEKYERNKVIF